MLQDDSSSLYTVAAVERMALICRQFSRTEPELTLLELADRTGIPVLSVAKMIATLGPRHFVRRAGAGARYGLGLAWLAVAEAKRRHFVLRDFVSPLLEAMRSELNETIAFAVHENDQRVVVDTIVSTQPIRRTPTKRPTPLHVGSSGRSMMAQFTDREIAAYLERTELKNIGHDTPTDARIIWDDIKKIRKQGYATAAAEITGESFSASAPVFSYAGTVLGALTITCPLSRLTADLKSACIHVVRTNAAALSYRLGFRPESLKQESGRKPSAAAKVSKGRPAFVPSAPMKPLRAVERALDVLACFDEEHRYLPLRRIVEDTGIHKATAFRFVATMVADDFLSIVAPRGPYALGFFPLRLADIILETNRLRLDALPWMRRISDELNETVVLMVRDGDMLTGVDRVDGHQAIVDSPEIGVPRPLHASPAGRTILGSFDEIDLQGYLSRQKLQGREKDDLVASLRSSRDAAGPDHKASLVRVAPIRQGRDVVGALSVSVPVDRASKQLVARVGRLLQEAAGALDGKNLQPHCENGIALADRSGRARAFSSEVDAGSREENASKQKPRARF
ncbi:IclR family transcriptional regulator [Roseiarcaceae bacterium H3SJ34-1]|uniref:IclR family transcriptional regulator n=1 Tax=Terripilifer ovatus TaxID=3032367 RepID=UPI003AB99E3E|nr:IclR family transcriptional regulator [Roseiarcaceae bacterium H3SJ34-1]